MMVFVLSLDLVLGYAGIATLGHAALFGCGAYAAGSFAVHVSGDPLLGLVAGALAGAAVAFYLGAAPDAGAGADAADAVDRRRPGVPGAGQQGRHHRRRRRPVGDPHRPALRAARVRSSSVRSAIWYALTVLHRGAALARDGGRVPFGLAARGIHESPARMAAIGTPVYRRLLRLHGGGRGRRHRRGLAAQVTSSQPRGAGLRPFGRSGGDAGPGRHRAALWGHRRRGGVHGGAPPRRLGRPVQLAVHIGALVLSRGVLRAGRPARPAGAAAPPVARSTMSAGLRCAASTSTSAGWWSPRTSASTCPPGAHGANRAERRRQDHLRQPDHRYPAAELGTIRLDGRDIRRLREAERVKAGIAKTFQITTLFRRLTVRENIRLPVLERRAARGAHLAAPTATRPSRPRSTRWSPSSTSARWRTGACRRSPTGNSAWLRWR